MILIGHPKIWEVLVVMMMRRLMRIVAGTTVILLLTSITAGVHAQPGSVASVLRVGDLRVNYASNPIGIDDAKPEFAWKLFSKQRAVEQTAYQIRVASSPDKLVAGQADVWDSGKVASRNSVHVAYGGPALRSATRYWWTVRVWDNKGNVSSWAPPAFFETGLLRRSDWKAQWIGASSSGNEKMSLDGAYWIWFSEGDPSTSAPAATRYFRRSFNLPSGQTVYRARFLLTADDQFVLYVNGKEVARSSGQPDAWRQAVEVDLSESLESGSRNVIAVAVTNTGGPASWIGKLHVDFADGTDFEIVTDRQWRATTDSPEGWEQSSFDDATWVAAMEVAPYGGGPWGRQVQIPKEFPGLELRKEFSVTKSVARARLYASALGLYELRLNGKRVGDHVFAPGWTDYNRRVQYQTYDVTSMLHEGQNALGALLGYGWFAGGIAWNRFTYGDQPYLLVQLEITYADGSKDIVVSDGSWRWRRGPIVSSTIYDGEIYDARLEQPGWDRPGFDDSDWQPVTVNDDVDAELVAQVGPPVRVTQDIRPVSVSEPKKGTFVFDMGQNFAGWVRLKVRGPAGTRITLRYGEVLNPDGTLYTANLRGAKATDVYILKGQGTEVFEPHFTYHGFRYVEVTGFPGKPTLDSITGRVVHSDTPKTGRFVTSNDLINQLQSNIVWGQRSNFFSVPTDCPQRDERLGWMGDAQMFAPTASFNMDVSGFFTKWMRDVADAQRADGAFTDVSPNVCCGAGTAGWGDAGIIIPWTIYQRYGDTRIIEEHYDAMKRWIEYLEAHSTNLLRPAQGYGDWLNVNDDTPRDVIGTAFFAYSTKLLANMARAIGRDADAQRYEDLFERIKAAFNDAYVSADGRIKGDTQTAYVLALYMDLLPQDLRDEAAARLVELIKARNWHLSTGFLGTPHLLDVLTEAGYSDVAYRLLNQDTFPSWLYMVKKGATTIWERWDSIRPDGSFNDPGMNSFNHYGFGSVGDWMYRNIGAIAPGAPGYEKIVVRPVLGGGLTEAKAKYESIRGEIEVDWKVERKTFKLKVAIPANSKATVYVPTSDPSSVTEGGKPAELSEGVKFLRYEDGYAVYEVGSGKYHFASQR